MLPENHIRAGDCVNPARGRIQFGTHRRRLMMPAAETTPTLTRNAPARFQVAA